MAQTVNNVSAAKPAVGGAVSVGALNATLPTSTSSTLTGFTALGYISEDGLTHNNTPESEEIKAWGGDIVLTPFTGKTDTFTFTLIEALNVEVLKVIYGSSNVTGTSLSVGYTVNAKAAELILRDEHDFIVVYNGNYDSKMHKFAPESLEALSELRCNVETFATFSEMIKTHWTGHDTLVGFAMDHGCHEIDGQSGSHGLDMPEDLNIVHLYQAYPRREDK